MLHEPQQQPRNRLKPGPYRGLTKASIKKKKKTEAKQQDQQQRILQSRSRSTRAFSYLHQQSKLSGKFHKEESTIFSLIFGNFPFPRTLARTSHNIFFRICSSVQGWPACLISFLVLQMLYTAEPRTSRQSKPLRELQLQESHPS
jgi:hypothetical protein